MDSVIVLNVKNRKTWPAVILVHHGASLTGSASIPGDILLGSMLVSSEFESSKGEAEVERLESPKGDAGATFLAFKAAFRVLTSEGATSPPAPWPPSRGSWSLLDFQGGMHWPVRAGSLLKYYRSIVTTRCTHAHRCTQVTGVCGHTLVS